MTEFEITNEEIQIAEELLYRMEEAAEPGFKELFPNLDYVTDFLRNDNMSDIEFIFDVVEKAAREEGRGKYDALYKLVSLNFEILIDEEFRKNTFEILRGLDKDKKEEFLRWMEDQGVPNEKIQNPDFLAGAASFFFRYNV